MTLREAKKFLKRHGDEAVAFAKIPPGTPLVLEQIGPGYSGQPDTVSLDIITATTPIRAFLLQFVVRAAKWAERRLTNGRPGMRILIHARKTDAGWELV